MSARELFSSSKFAVLRNGKHVRVNPTGEFMSRNDRHLPNIYVTSEKSFKNCLKKSFFHEILY